MHTPPAAKRQFLSTLSLIAFGLCTLAYLEAIGHPQWFHIRPASGTSLAMAHASDGGSSAASTASAPTLAAH